MTKEEIRSIIVSKIAGGRVPVPDNHKLMYIHMTDARREISSRLGFAIKELPSNTITVIEAVDFFYGAIGHESQS